MFIDKVRMKSERDLSLNRRDYLVILVIVSLKHVRRWFVGFGVVLVAQESLNRSLTCKNQILHVSTS